MDMSKDCMVCGKEIGHRGFCSEKCHNEYYDNELSEMPKDVSKDGE